MVRRVTLLLWIYLLAVSCGEAVKCYHCYDSFNKPSALGTLNNSNSGEKFVRCDKNKNNWNTWDCPAYWPLCIVISASVGNRYEVVRSCAEKDLCSLYIPPNGVKVDYCHECNTTLCNDYPQLLDPPEGPGTLFRFNININLNVKKFTTFNNKYTN